MIKTNHLSKYYGTFRAADDVSIEIAQGECVGLLGLNGAGKTTLLRMLTCLLTPTAGSASIDGLDVSESSFQVRRRIGFLPESPPLYGEMAVDRFLAFAARLRRVPSADVEQNVRHTISRCQLADVATQAIETLSWGFKKRVGIAQALVHQPPLVVLDEPIAGLDPAQIVEMRELIKTLRGEHTILLSSHILGEISQTCDRILVMHAGRIAAQGTENELVGSFAENRRLRITVLGDHEKVGQVLTSLAGAGELQIIAAPEAGVEGPLTLELGVTDDIRSDVARALVGAGLDLLELQELHDDLESVFLRLTGKREERR
jgi:ABC-2 type transport system ATP-binding protein